MIQGKAWGFFLIRLMLDADPTCTSGYEVVLKYVQIGSGLRRVVILFSGGVLLMVAEGVIQVIAGDNIDDGPLILA